MTNEVYQSPKLSIDPQFATMAWPLTTEEEQYLLESLKAEGCREPVVFWLQDGVPIEQCVIIDGHNRYRLCNEHGIPYKAVGIRFATREQALDWALVKQLGRRNASEVQKCNLRGQLFLIRKKEKQASGERNVDISRQIAEEFGISRRTAIKDASLATAINKIKDVAPTFCRALIDANIPMSTITQIGQRPQNVLRAAEGVFQRSRNIRMAVRAATTIEDRRPIVDKAEFAMVERALARLVKLRGELYTACGGFDNPTAREFDRRFKEACNSVAEVLAQWEIAFDVRSTINQESQ